MTSAEPVSPEAAPGRPKLGATRSLFRALTTEVFAPADLGRSVVVNPLIWRLPMWAVITLVTVLEADGLPRRIASGVLLGVGAIALQFITNSARSVRVAALLIATAGGVAACFASHGGLGEALVFVAAARAPMVLDGLALRIFAVLDTVAAAVTVAVITDSWYGLLAGIGVPLLIERSIEQRELLRERDRVAALLVEARAGREAEASAAALRERGRIAREMHDVLAHSLAGLSVQLQAARAVAARAGANPAVLEPLDTAAALAKDGLAEARSAVGALRDPGGLGLDALPVLVDRSPATVSMTTSGTPGVVTDEAGHAVYRGVQESLTNAMRYAPGAEIAVRLDWHHDSLDVTVRDTGRARGHQDLGATSTGLGLAGMAERIEQAGGTMHAGPDPDGGWLVRLTVPTSADDRTVRASTSDARP